MRRCKNCGTIYSDACAECPKCMETISPPIDNDDAASKNAFADKHTIRRAWAGIIIGIPLFIAFIYLIYYLIKLCI